jgi:hypothetical protein
MAHVPDYPFIKAICGYLSSDPTPAVAPFRREFREAPPIDSMKKQMKKADKKDDPAKDRVSTQLAQGLQIGAVRG